MTIFRGLGMLLSSVFGCLLLALVAELYYLLWWKQRINTNRTIEQDYSNHAKELFYLFCRTKPTSNNTNLTNPDANQHDPDVELGSSKDLLIKPLEKDDTLESEIIRVHNLNCPPRFLFTIKEETREDLESDDGKSRGERSRKGSRTKSLSDMIVGVETPHLSPLSSPKLKLCADFKDSLDPLGSYVKQGVNPLFESMSSMEVELDRLRYSPPPKFKFLRDAEEKLYRKLLQEAQKSGILHKNCEEKFVSGKNKEREIQQYSSSSQVLPLASSPPASLSPSSKLSDKN